MKINKNIPLFLVFLLIVYSIINILQHGLFNIKGIQIPFLMYHPHALTVILWCILFIIIYLKTDYLPWWLRILVIGGFLSLGEFLSGDIANIIQISILTGQINLTSLFIGSQGLPTFLTMNILVLIYVYYFHQKYSFLKLNKMFVLSLFLFILSIGVLIFTNFWQRWELYLNETLIDPPHSWDWLFYKTTGILMWIPLIKTNSLK